MKSKIYIVLTFDTNYYPSVTQYITAFATEEKAQEYVETHRQEHGRLTELYYEEKEIEETYKKPRNRFAKTIKEKVYYPNSDGQYGAWDGLPRDVRRFLVEWADYTEALERKVDEYEIRTSGCNPEGK